MSIGTNSPAFHVWVRMVRSHRRVVDAVESAFRAQGLPSLEWYDVLLELERCGKPLRARDLEQKLLLAQYNLSRLLDRMEGRGMIARQPDPEDGRSRLIRISEQGLATRREMWPVYRRVVEGSIGQRLTNDQAQQLVELLAPIAADGETRR